MPEDDAIKRVVGLKYVPEEGPPRVILKGAGKTAEAVADRARQLAEHKLVKDKHLVDQLFRLPVDAPIDTDLFQLVAVLLVHVYKLDETLKRAAKERDDLPDAGRDDPINGRGRSGPPER